MKNAKDIIEAFKSMMGSYYIQAAALLVAVAIFIFGTPPLESEELQASAFRTLIFMVLMHVVCLAIRLAEFFTYQQAQNVVIVGSVFAVYWLIFICQRWIFPAEGSAYRGLQATAPGELRFAVWLEAEFCLCFGYMVGTALYLLLDVVLTAKLKLKAFDFVDHEEQDVLAVSSLTLQFWLNFFAPCFMMLYLLYGL